MKTAFSLESVLRGVPHHSVGLLETLLEAAGERFAVHLVGGPVRDLLLERPLRDIDLVVEGLEIDVAEKLARRAFRQGARITSHARFGTVHIEAGGGSLDLATTRSETYSGPGALPRVEAASLEVDRARRDFSVNTLTLELKRASRGKRVSVAGVREALADLEAGRLRTLHPRSFHDDATRILRAARLASRLGFQLGRAERSQLRAALRDGAFGAISGDRLRREFDRLFADAALGAAPIETLRNLSRWHALAVIEPGLGLSREAGPALRRLGRSIETSPWRHSSARPLISGLCVWLAEEEAPIRRRALERLGVRGEAAVRIAAFPRRRARDLRALERARGRGAVDAILEDLDEDSLLALHASASARSLRRRIERWAGEDRRRRSPLSGSDLLALGLEGPAVGRALTRIRGAFLDGAVANREEALALASEIALHAASKKARRPRKPKSGQG